jgi:hypothetical protein
MEKWADCVELNDFSADEHSSKHERCLLFEIASDRFERSIDANNLFHQE